MKKYIPFPISLHQQWRYCMVFTIVISFWACTPNGNKELPEIRRAQASDFADTSQVSLTLAEGFYLSLWAPGSLLSNAVALTLDNQGVAYVSETSRRKSSDIDIRAHRDWMTEDLGLHTIEDTEAFHKRKLDPSLSEENTWLDDMNGDSIRDWRDLQVQSEYIRRIWDEDGDGKADVFQPVCRRV